MLLVSFSFGCYNLHVCLTFEFNYISFYGCLLFEHACVDVLNINVCICLTCSLCSSNLLDLMVFFPQKKNYLTALFCVIVVYALHIIRLYLVFNYSLILCKLPASLVSMNMSVLTSAGSQNCILFVKLLALPTWLRNHWSFTGEWIHIQKPEE